MKLEKIKLSGFKSFVDPTTIPVNGNLTAIVGPNGCGKSNIIDAVRWVMGESSAKHLRGGSMADVIFNGSSTRKPVSTAFVELVFDNGEGKAGGEFAKYNTISIKRQVSRDGQSQYHLNGSRCRRKDITDLFLGTGLGSRSYAIIEQGTISRMVEAKPEDLRIHIEEAAGISKYKERRQETETRMRHTRENLERLDDLREEVEKQLKHLQKQAEKAEKYTELKQQERQVKQELLAMRWNNYHQSALKLENQLQEIAAEHNRLFVLLRETDKQIEEKRAGQKRQQQQLDEAQGEYYHVVAEVSRLEQTIRHNEKSHEETSLEINRLQRQSEQSIAECQQDMQQLEDIRQSLVEAEEALVIAREREEETEIIQSESQQRKFDWQQQWEAFLAESARYREQSEVQRAKLGQLENQQRQQQIRVDKLRREQSELSDSQLQADMEALESTIDQLETGRDELHRQLEQQHQQIGEQRQRVKQLQDQLHTQRAELHGISGKITSLELLQQHAMGKDKKDLAPWLERMQLAQQPRLAEFLEVDGNWEAAVETVLSSYLEAICVDDVDLIVPGLQYLGEQSVILVENRSLVGTGDGSLLLSKIRSNWDLSALLSGIHCADTIEQGREKLRELQDYETVVLPDGTWLGKNWLKVARSTDSKTGVLHREKELRGLKLRQQELQASIDETELQLEDTELALKNSEANRESIQQQDKRLSAELSSKTSEFSAHSARHEQQQRRLHQVGQEVDEIVADLAENAEAMAEAEVLKQEAERQLERLEMRKMELEQTNQELQVQQNDSDRSLNEARRQVLALQAQIESLKSSEQLTARQIERLQSQNRQSAERIEELQAKLDTTISPMDDEKMVLERYLEQKQALDRMLKQEREALQDTENSISRLAEQHSKTQREMERQKEALDKVRFQQQDSNVRQQTLIEQLQEINADPEQILQGLVSDADERAWKRKADELTVQIERLGSINLTAIEEYKSQSERMNFLNEQHDDLMEALNTLDQAINKIDKESRQRFKETFDKINAGLQEKFPRLFGGGQAYLELTEQDLLETGVNIIARPPGKRNSSIHLLSGGEKALTAVALVFSIFELNPAPFCLLDEVDAPLDDANVVRFSQMVEDMSSSVQFLYISHNKVTMEIAKQLAGVTMKEPGVSRMVAVDIEEAVIMAES
ncbi:chromosome segregation protein SMC [Methylomarinum vadi]|uniref:chromosome segregation protein SMC n=1 Tax=Methylomarinum vadi TaxID=438855 RepID=UPI0004DF814A|nr:chromosome segregation protein SMC [Methylomarinum vadi]